MTKPIISKEYKQIDKGTILVSHLLISESNSSCAPDSVLNIKWTETSAINRKLLTKSEPGGSYEN
jgi:hypothetical protein